MMIDEYLRNKAKKQGFREAEGKKGGAGYRDVHTIQCTSKTVRNKSTK